MHRFFASTKNTRPVLPGSLRYIRSDAPLQVTEEKNSGWWATTSPLWWTFAPSGNGRQSPARWSRTGAFAVCTCR